MFEQRQEQRLRLLLLSPAVVIVLIAAYAVLSAHQPGNSPREGMFDLFTRLAPRAEEVVAAETATILIDEESVERLGAWPWPRSALGALVDAAENAGAASVTVTTSVAGEDPFSPDVIARRWMRGPASPEQDSLAALSLLPSNDLILARAIAGGPVSLSLAPQLRGTNEDVRWQRVSVGDARWIDVAGGESNLGFAALPAILGNQSLSAELREARVEAAAAFPKDRDGVARRVAPVYAAGERPVATGGLAGLAASGISATLGLSPNSVSSAGAPPVAITIADGPAIPLDERAEMRLWLPQELNVPSVPAWRVLDAPDAWTNSLRGKHVFIGETVSPDGVVRTPRGRMAAAKLHALTADQLASGDVPSRPGWSGLAEGFAALLFGAAAVVAVIFLPASLATISVALLGLVGFIGAFFVFRSSGMLLDPGPAIFASFGGPMAVGLTVLINMAFRDDRVRGAFHGALPAPAMRKLQSHGGAKLLQGVHRDVTVISCAFRLPKPLIERFAQAPRDYVLFQASANDRLRRTILEHEGTVDFGEDGRLLGYWNVPLENEKHIELACSCALKMLDDVSAMSQQVSESHHVGRGGAMEDLADGRVEIGISTGPSFAGPVGLGGRNRYAALGQPVDFAGRLRARSELYGPAILTDAKIYDALRHHYAFLDLDFVRRDHECPPETIYGLVGNPFLKASKGFRNLAEVQRALLDAWRERDLTSATRHLQKLRGIPGVPQPYVELFERRIMQARVHGTRRQSDLAEVLGP